jgi:hypothetical protein
MDKVKQELVDICEKEINRGNIFVGFYKKQEEATKDKEAKAKIGLKIKQSEDAVSFNTEFLNYLKSI